MAFSIQNDQEAKEILDYVETNLKNAEDREQAEKELNEVIIYMNETKNRELCSRVRGIICDNPDLEYKAKLIVMDCENPEVCKSKVGGSKTNNKVHVLGRDRIVTKKGRTCYVTYQKKEIPLSKARELEKVAKKSKAKK